MSIKKNEVKKLASVGVLDESLMDGFEGDASKDIVTRTNVYASQELGNTNTFLPEINKKAAAQRFDS